MKKLKFRTNSRHISQLGRELVTDFVTALVELIKNSYDADAYGVKIILDKPNTPDSKIILIDTGSGMTQEDFENKWMVIGTNNKVTEPFSIKGRKKAGKKGIGRFSVERIAEKVSIYSFTSNEEPFKVNINWNSFEDINISSLIQRINILKDHEDPSAAKFICSQIEYFFLTNKVDKEDKDLVAALLKKKELKYSMFYNQEFLDILKNDIVPILKKYEDIEQLVEEVESSLEIIDPKEDVIVYNLLNDIYQKYNLNTPQTGMILVMKGLRDQWKQKDIDKLQKELRLLVAPDLIEKDPFKIELVAPEFQIDDIILVNEILDLKYAKVEAKIYNNGKKVHICYNDRDGKSDLIEEVSEEPYLCGDIDAEIYFFLRDSNNLTNAGAGYNFRFAQKMLDTYCGIKIYRDSFRVKPYGDIGNDWLFLDQKKVKDTHGYLVGNNQVIGVIKISDITNPLLVDATNREGIIENEAYEQLKHFITRCTNLISDVRRKAYLEKQERERILEEQKSKIDDQFNNVKQQYQSNSFVKQIEEVTKVVNKEDIPKKLEILVKAYIEDSERKKSDIQKLQLDYDKHYNDTKKMYQEKINFQESELNLYKNLASLGMLTGSFGHETSDIVSRIQTSIHLANIYLDINSEKEKIKDIIEIVNDDFKRIYSYSNLIVNFLRKRKRESRVDVELDTVLKEVCGFYSNIVASFDVELKYHCQEGITFFMKQIDLESIIINMITNAFEQVKGRTKRIIQIEIKQSISHIILNFEDSGNGVPKGKENDIFRPFETTKEEGIGLGLNIVKDIVENYNGEIKVERSEALLGAKFIVLFPKGGSDE
ncbi:sensor histidine kinase [Clostridium sp. P21]|uniref:histidine kinase n=1 Tax=Clostridium muellerianum TaxID=2716538 RepID=A0A7Y0HR72_9CLOT|nr:sensor histidine kinase [Clostridium muellerianum]NMM65820.1 sensor histidine kinase [Clostridium muellerianum]